MRSIQKFALAVTLSVAVMAVGCSSGSGDVSATAESPPRPGADAPDDVGDHPTSTTAPTGTEPQPPDPGDVPIDGADGPLCDAARRIRQLDDQANGIMNDALKETLTDPSQTEARLTDALAELEPMVPKLTEAYDDLAASAPESIVEDIGVVRSFTISLMGQLASMESMEDFQQLQGSLDNESAMAAGMATLEIDAVTRAQCGISIAN